MPPVGYPVSLNQPIIALIGNAAVIAVAVIARVSLASIALVSLITGQRF